MQRQRPVTAYFSSQQLLLFAFGLKSTFKVYDEPSVIVSHGVRVEVEVEVLHGEKTGAEDRLHVMPGAAQLVGWPLDMGPPAVAYEEKVSTCAVLLVLLQVHLQHLELYEVNLCGGEVTLLVAVIVLREDGTGDETFRRHQARLLAHDVNDLFYKKDHKVYLINCRPTNVSIVFLLNKWGNHM